MSSSVRAASTRTFQERLGSGLAEIWLDLLLPLFSQERDAA